MRDSPEAFAPPPIDLMDCFPAALLQLRDNGQIAHFNLAWAELMGAPGAERNLMDYVHQEDRPLWRQALNELRRRPDTSFNQRLRFVHPSGELRWFEISLKRGPPRLLPGGRGRYCPQAPRNRLAGQPAQQHELARQHAGPDLSRPQQPRLDHGIRQRRLPGVDRLPR